MTPTVITKDNYETEVTRSEKTVLLDFWAAWCGPCRMLSPTVDEIADQREDIKVGKINVDDEPELAERFGIMSIPTLVIVKGGEPVGQSVGVRPKEDILEMIENS